MKQFNYIIPIVSVLILAVAWVATEPTTTGLVIYDANQELSNLIDANVRVQTRDGEVIPPDAVVIVRIDDREARMPLAEFILGTNQPYELAYGELPEFGFSGEGFTGDHLYFRKLSDFAVNRDIDKGAHIFTISLQYRGYTLFEQEQRIMAGGVQDARDNK